MTDFYWVGDGGTINDSAHWAASSGGAGGAGVPTSADNSFFDANSFTASGQIVLLDDTVGSFDCLSMDWTGVLHNPKLRVNTNLGVNLNVHENFILSTGMSMDRLGSANVRDSSLSIKSAVSNIIDAKGVSIPIPVSIDNSSGGNINVDLNSNFVVPSFIQIGFSSSHSFSFYTNDHHLTFGFMNNGHSSNLISNFWGASVFDINGFTDLDGRFTAGILFGNSGSTVTESTSIINLNYNPNASNFNFYDIGLFSQSVGEVKTLGTSSLSNAYVIGDQTFGSGSEIRKLTLKPDDFVTFVDGGLFNIDTLDANGSSGHTITFRSDSTPLQYTINSTSVSVSFVDVKDCIASGATPFDDSVGGVDSGNNVNWIFAAPNVQAVNTDYTTVQGVINVLDCMGQVTGVVYGPTTNPTIADSSITTASIVGPFFVDIPTLIIPGTTTYLRPYTLCSGVYKYYNQIVVTVPAISPILLATDNLIGIYQIEILDGSNNIICNLTGIASNLSFVISRNRPEEILFSVPLLVLEQLAKDIFTSMGTILNTGINAVRIKRKNQILLAGQLDFWETNFDDPNRPMINIKAHGWLALLAQRIFSGEYISQDANFIMRDMITQTQALTHGDYGITLGTSAVGSNSYADKIFENKIISDAFIEFADEAAGVDFSFTWDKVFNIYWPRKGSQRQDILFTYPGNTESMSISSDSTKIVNNLLGRGQGNANSNINTIINDATSQTNYKLRSAVKDFPDIQSADQLVNITGSEVDFFKNPLILHALRYSGSEPSCPEVGTYDIGDSMRATIAFLDTFSGVSGGFYKLDKQTVQLTENGEEKVQLEFNNQPD